MIASPLKWHGGKHYLARRIVELMPRHLHYVEPFFGGGSVLFEKDPEGISEVVNDINGRLSNFWRVLQDESTFARFHRIIEAVPFSEREWRYAEPHPDDPVADARRATVLDRPALDVILGNDGPRTLFYLDPRTCRARVRPRTCTPTR